MSSTQSYKAFFNIIKEALVDRIPNEQVDVILAKLCHNLPEFLSDPRINSLFISLLVEYSIDHSKKVVFEVDLRNRAKLMNKYIIRDSLHYYLQLLLEIVCHCQQLNLPLNKIDQVIEILQEEHVLSPLIRSHWFCAKSDSPEAEKVVHQRCAAISQCIRFLNKMEMDDLSEQFSLTD